ncbi:MAG: alkaline phosphatase family protein [Phycisphaerales bacterium]
MRVAVLNVVGLSPSVFARRKSPAHQAFAQRSGGIRTLEHDFPAVTCTVQSSMLTGRRPEHHGIVGNGWYDRSLGEVHFWKQSNALVRGPMVWDTLRARAREAGRSAPTVANSFWWFNMHSSADVCVTPRPQYRADGRKVPDCWTRPSDLRDALQRELGPFPLFKFWGPAAGIESTDWIAAAARRVEERFEPALHVVYLPHLDYCLQKFGPDDARVDPEIREIDRVFAELERFFAARGVQVMVVSEYGISPVSRAECPNRLLRAAGLLSLRIEDGRELLDAGESRVFAVCDHQAAHVYVRDPADLPAAREALERSEGVERILDADAQRAAGIHHARSGELVLVARAGWWFAYPWWEDDRRAPDWARTVDIHRKPGYDPLELFMDPGLRLPKAYVAGKLALRAAGMRTLLDVVPLDPALVRGSHGRVEHGTPYAPVLIADGVHEGNTGPLPATAVHDAILEACRS